MPLHHARSLLHSVFPCLPQSLLGQTCVTAIAMATIELSYIVTYMNIGPLREDNSRFPLHLFLCVPLPLFYTSYVTYHYALSHSAYAYCVTYKIGLLQGGSRPIQTSPTQKAAYPISRTIRAVRPEFRPSYSHWYVWCQSQCTNFFTLFQFWWFWSDAVRSSREVLRWAVLRRPVLQAAPTSTSSCWPFLSSATSLWWLRAIWRVSYSFDYCRTRFDSNGLTAAKIVTENDRYRWNSL